MDRFKSSLINLVHAVAYSLLPGAVISGCNFKEGCSRGFSWSGEKSGKSRFFFKARKKVSKLEVLVGKFKKSTKKVDKYQGFLCLFAFYMGSCSYSGTRGIKWVEKVAAGQITGPI